MAADAAPAPVPEFPVPGPEHPGWEEFRRIGADVLTAAGIVFDAMRDGPPEDERWLQMGTLLADAVGILNKRASRIVLDEAVTLAREDRAYERGRADERAARRCRLRRNPGNLRAVSDG